MEESLIMEEKDFSLAVSRAFDRKKADPAGLSPLVLAYIGDGVYEMIVRSILVSCGNEPVNSLNRRAKKLVCASAQAAIIHSIAEDLKEEEAAAYRRGRNAKSYTVAKNASVSDYRHATGLEALCGYLYLNGSYDRLAELIRLGMDRNSLLPEKRIG